MRKIVLTLAALAAFGIAMPVVSSAPASAETVIIKKKHRDYGWHRGWHRDWHHHHGAKVIIRR